MWPDVDRVILLENVFVLDIHRKINISSLMLIMGLSHYIPVVDYTFSDNFALKVLPEVFLSTLNE